MKRLIVTAFLLPLLIIRAVPLAAGGEWKKIKDADGIRVYERPVPATGLVEYLAVTAIPEKMEVIGEALRDVDSFNQWISDCKEAKIVKKHDKNNFITYMVLNPPVIEERDIVLEDKTIYDFDHGKAAISFFSIEHGAIPPKKGRTRVAVMDGDYTMEFLGRDRTKFIYRLKVDPAGSIPKNVAYAVMKQFPYKTLSRLKNIVKQGKYSAAARGSFEEKRINTLVKNEGAVRRILACRLAKFVRNRDVLRNIIMTDQAGIKSIVASGGSYASVEKATTGLLLEYVRRTADDRAIAENLANNRNMTAEISDMVINECGIDHLVIDDIVEKYRSRDSR